MGHFDVHLTTPRPATEAFARILDFDAHTDLIPLTTVHHTTPLEPGNEVVAHTGIGPLGFDDPMRIREYTPPTATEPGRCAITKTGPWVGGDIELTVTPVSVHTSTVRWRQHITVRGVSRVADRLVTRVAEVAYRRVLERLLSRG